MDYTNTDAVFHADYSIDSITTSDNGTYTCTVTNPIGSDSATITVVVNGKLFIYIANFNIHEIVCLHGLIDFIICFQMYFANSDALSCS